MPQGQLDRPGLAVAPLVALAERRAGPAPRDDARDIGLVEVAPAQVCDEARRVAAFELRGPHVLQRAYAGLAPARVQVRGAPRAVLVYY